MYSHEPALSGSVIYYFTLLYVFTGTCSLRFCDLLFHTLVCIHMNLLSPVLWFIISHSCMYLHEPALSGSVIYYFTLLYVFTWTCSLRFCDLLFHTLVCIYMNLLSPVLWFIISHSCMYLQEPALSGSVIYYFTLLYVFTWTCSLRFCDLLSHTLVCIYMNLLSPVLWFIISHSCMYLHEPALSGSVIYYFTLLYVFTWTCSPRFCDLLFHTLVCIHRKLLSPVLWFNISHSCMYLHEPALSGSVIYYFTLLYVFTWTCSLRFCDLLFHTLVCIYMNLLSPVLWFIISHSCMYLHEHALSGSVIYYFTLLYVFTWTCSLRFCDLLFHTLVCIHMNLLSPVLWFIISHSCMFSQEPALSGSVIYYFTLLYVFTWTCSLRFCDLLFHTLVCIYMNLLSPVLWFIISHSCMYLHEPALSGSVIYYFTLLYVFTGTCSLRFCDLLFHTLVCFHRNLLSPVLWFIISHSCMYLHEPALSGSVIYYFTLLYVFTWTCSPRFCDLLFHTLVCIHRKLLSPVLWFNISHSCMYLHEPTLPGSVIYYFTLLYVFTGSCSLRFCDLIFHTLVCIYMNLLSPVLWFIISHSCMYSQEAALSGSVI